MDDIITGIDKKYEEGTDNKGNVLARDIFHSIIKEHGSNEDRIYFA